MKKAFNIAIISVMVLLLGGCVTDDIVDLCPIDVYGDGVQITVTVPGQTVPETRSIADGGEAVVSELDVMVFKSGATVSDPQILTECVSGTIVSQSNTDSDNYKVTFVAKLTENSAASNIVVIANATDAVDAALGALPNYGIDSEKQDILAALTFSNTGEWNTNKNDVSDPEAGTDYDAIPMYGEKAITGGVSGDIKIDGIELTRMVARIDVVNSATADFTVSDVMLVNRNSGGYIAPAWDVDGILKTSLPDPPMIYGSRIATPQTVPYKTGGLLGEIYTFEAIKTTGVEGTDEHTNAVCLIISGKLTGDNTLYYYRVDFTDPTLDINGKRPSDAGYIAPSPDKIQYMPIYRNHLYEVDIERVDGPGYTTAEDAQKSLGVLSNLKTQLHVVDQSGINDIVFDGQHWLGTDESILVFRGEGGEQSLDARTNYSYGWKVANIKYVTGSGWLTSPTTATTGSGETASATVTCIANPNGTPRVATFELTAGRLRKTITVVQMPLSEKITADAVIPNSYVGAFWKTDQTGERLIRIPRPASGYDGAWTAMVIEGEDWITLDKEMTSDANVGWRTDVTPTETSVDNGNDAGFDTHHAVTDGKDYVTGLLGTPPAGTMPPLGDDSEQVYFRIGLNSQYVPTENAPARYGVVLLTYANNTKQQRIWIRQGEEADYLMRPEDPSTGDFNSATRPAAVKFSPYNLTAETLNAQVYQYGTTTGGSTASKLTDYPSQAGASWQWANAVNSRVAWSPVGTVSGWLNTYPDNFWDTLGATHESCPEGYRRPTAGPVNAATPLSNLSLGEQQQSIYLKPMDVESSVSNSVYGYYADGFFDRRQVVAILSGKPAVAVAADQTEVAYIGRLFYNPNSLSSLFFPAGRQRESADGAMTSDGTGIAYWSSSASSSGIGISFGFGSSATNMGSNSRSYGRLIRCVYDENLVPPEKIETVPDTDDPVPAGVTPYVGAFWKADQTGERLIRFDPAATAAYGNWTAQVVEGEDWIVLDKVMTSDPNVGWKTGATDGTGDFGNDAGFDETHAVTTGDWWVKGKADVNNALYFRIGLKSKYTPTAEAPARYGVVLLTYKDNSLQQRIWIRQGEEADYVMRPEDPMTTNAPRTNAARFSPYNLTAAEFNKPVSINGDMGDPGLQPGIFTDYPSQGGALWQWAGATTPNDVVRYAWAPISAGTGTPAGWNSTAISGDWATLLAATNETCPAGYRRPTDNNTGEMRQSLWLNFNGSETNNTNANNHNITWGYYADGWFDRRKTVDVETKPAVAVGYDTVNPGGSAFIGGLFFNPTTFASLFMPAPGTRGHDGASYPTKKTENEPVGEGGIYYTVLGGSFRFAVRQPGSNIGTGSQAVAASIRCVKE